MRFKPALPATGWANVPPPGAIYQHMPGGGGLKGTNYCYSVAPTDGSVLCLPLNPFPLM